MPLIKLTGNDQLLVQALDQLGLVTNEASNNAISALHQICNFKSL